MSGAVSAAEGSEAGDAEAEAAPDAQHLVKLSYHDSGIDIRDPMLHVTPANSKKVRANAVLDRHSHTAPRQSGLWRVIAFYNQPRT